MKENNDPKTRPTVKVKPRSYQPTKRGYYGTYHSMSGKHLQTYVD